MGFGDAAPSQQGPSAFAGIRLLVQYASGDSWMPAGTDTNGAPATEYKYNYWLIPSGLVINIKDGEGSALRDRNFRAIIDYIN